MRGHPALGPFACLPREALDLLWMCATRRMDELTAVDAPLPVWSWWGCFRMVVESARRWTVVPTLDAAGRLQLAAQLEAEAFDASATGCTDLAALFTDLQAAVVALRGFQP